MRILFLAQRVPYPPNRGDKIATFRLIDRMSRRHTVSCVAFAHDESDFEAAVALTERGIRTWAVPYNDRWAKLRSAPLILTKKPLTLGVYGSKALQAHVDRLVPSMDLGYAFSSSMGVFLEPHRNLPRVMHFAELDSDKWHQYSERASLPMRFVYRREWRTLLEVERRIAKSFDENVLITPLEQKIFREQIPGASSVVIRNGVDLVHYTPEPERAETRHLVFVGVMNYLPNVDGCIHFVKEVLPRLLQRYPDTRLTIVGSKPTPEVEALASHPAVSVTGFVPEPRDYLKKAAVSVAPLRIARGIQNKVLEAMAMGVPVVGTTSATQGIEGEPGRDFLLADGVEAQVEAIASLFAEPDRARALGAAGRRLVEEKYDWESALRPLDELLARFEAGPAVTARPKWA